MTARAVVAVAAATLVMVAPAGAKTFEVTRTGDTAPNGCGQGGCTLREAILAANARTGADVVELRSGKTYELQIPGALEDLAATGDLDVTEALTIRKTERRRATIDAQGVDGVLDAFARLAVDGVVVEDGLTGVRTAAPLSLRSSRVTGNIQYGIQSNATGDSISLVGSAITGNGYQGIQQNVGGGISLLRSRISGNDFQGIQQYGDGGVRLIRSKVVGQEFQGIQEYEAGSVSLVRSSVDGQGNQGVQEYDRGDVSLVRSSVSGNEHQGIQESEEGAVRLARGTVSRNGHQGIQTYDEGGLRINRGKVSGNGSQGIQAYDDASATVRRAVIKGNDGRGLELYVEQTYAVSNSTITSNEGGMVFGDGAGKITGSTINGNTVLGDGGGIDNETPLVIRNSTVAGNQASGDGGGIHNTGQLRLNNVTVVRNVADSDNSTNGLGGGLYNGLLLSSTEVGNSLIALNDMVGGNADDCWGAFDSTGGNLRSDPTECGDWDGVGDAVRANAKIGQLRRNGGPTETIALKRGSPAIGGARKATAEKRDQRGQKRDKQPDIGAYER